MAQRTKQPADKFFFFFFPFPLCWFFIQPLLFNSFGFFYSIRESSPLPNFVNFFSLFAFLLFVHLSVIIQKVGIEWGSKPGSQLHDTIKVERPCSSQMAMFSLGLNLRKCEYPCMSAFDFVDSSVNPLVVSPLFQILDKHFPKIPWAPHNEIPCFCGITLC